MQDKSVRPRSQAPRPHRRGGVAPPRLPGPDRVSPREPDGYPDRVGLPLAAATVGDFRGLAAWVVVRCRAGWGALPRQCSFAAQIAPPTPQTRRPSDTLRGKAAPTRQSTTMRAAEVAGTTPPRASWLCVAASAPQAA